jgi:hypothetical protein
MNEQGRATVLGWQQTVNAAWERQTGLLTAPTGPIPGPPDAGSGIADLDAARREFFGPVAPGTQRQILQTNAKVPGGKDGIILSRFYIADKYAALGNLYGDNRGPTTDPTAGHRFSVAWDTNTGEVSLTVQPSTIVGGSALGAGEGPILIPQQLEDRVVGALPINVGPGGSPNNFVVDQADPGHLKLSYNVLNSAIPIGEANGTFDISLDPKDITIRLQGDDYPDGEFIQYRPDGTQLLATKAMSPWKEQAVFPETIPWVDPIDKTFTHPH